MNKISSRQLFFFLAAVAPVGKIVFMPTQLTFYAKNDLLFPAAMNYLLQTAIVFCVLLLAKRESSLYEMLTYTFGKVTAKIITFLFSLFLMYAAFFPIMEQRLYVQSVFYDTLPSVVAFSSFFLFSAYLCSKPLSSCGRVWDILAPVSIVGYAGILLLSVSHADYGAIFPVGASGANGIFGSAAFSMSWFYDSAILLALVGKFDYKKGMAWKGALAYLAGGFAVLFFLATFYGIFSDIAVRQIFAFTKISKYFSGITVLGRIDYLFLFAITLVMAFYCALPLHAGVECFKRVFGTGKYLPSVYSVGINLLVLVLSIVFDYQFGAINDAITKTLFWIFPVFCVLLPLLAFFLRRSPREKTR